MSYDLTDIRFEKSFFHHFLVISRLVTGSLALKKKKRFDPAADSQENVRSGMSYESAGPAAIEQAHDGVLRGALAAAGWSLRLFPKRILWMQASSGYRTLLLVPPPASGPAPDARCLAEASSEYKTQL